MHFEFYLRAMQEYCTPEELRGILRKLRELGPPAKVERYLEALKWIEPAELEEILDLIETPKKAKFHVEEFKRRLEWWGWKARLGSIVRDTLMWIGLVGGLSGAVLVLQALLSYLRGS